ncbi:metalloprotease [Phlyctema vagabunda]|uniref:Metalloprotease n=1 Tax=Phlyctema vagabunda TaxID=108571 RepID=A0ABR4P3W3_9HELO
MLLSRRLLCNILLAFQLVSEIRAQDEFSSSSVTESDSPVSAVTVEAPFSSSLGDAPTPTELSTVPTEPSVPTPPVEPDTSLTSPPETTTAPDVSPTSPLPESSTAVIEITSSSPTDSLTTSPTSSSSTTATEPDSDDAVETDFATPDGYVQVSAESFTDDNVPLEQMNHGTPDPIVLSAAESAELAVMEGDFYADIVQNSPVPGTTPVTLPEVSCSSSTSRLVRRKKTCKTYQSFSFNVFFHYFWAPSTAPEGTPKNAGLSRADWEARINLQMDLLKTIFNPLGIYPMYNSKLYQYKCLKFTDHQKTQANRAYNRKIMADLRKGTDATLNVFLVNAINSDSFSEALGKTHAVSGYAEVVKSVETAGDGIIMDHNRLGNEKRNTLVHELGHWLGLEHTFGNPGSLCTLDDGLLDTTRTSGDPATISNCEQVACDGTAPARIVNWMSYASCRGYNTDGTLTDRGFTNDQKARMFARYLRYRAGITNACGKDPGVSKRRHEEEDDDDILSRRQSAAPISSLTNIRDGTCPRPGAPIPGTVHAAASEPPADLAAPPPALRESLVTAVAASPAAAASSTVSGVAGVTSAASVATTGPPTRTTSTAGATTTSASGAGGSSLVVPLALLASVQSCLLLYSSSVWGVLIWS